MYSAPQGPPGVMPGASRDPQLVLGLYPEPEQLGFGLGFGRWPVSAVYERCPHCQQATGDIVTLTGYPVLDTCPHCRRSLAPF